jgi:hypothetical protein
VERISLILFAVIGASALTTLTVFIALIFPWLHSIHRQIGHIQELLLYRDRDAEQPAVGIPELTNRDEDEGATPVAQFQLKASGRTISVVESGGKRFMKIDGLVTRRERDQLIRYLRSEGFLD